MDKDTFPNDYQGSPCIDICTLDTEGLVCLGCRRTVEEITGWSTMTNEQKYEVWQRLRVRKP